MANVSFISASKLVELVNAADTHNDMQVRVLSGSRLALGADPLQPTYMIDLSKEKIYPYNPAELTKSLDQPSISLLAARQTLNVNDSKVFRRRGNYWFEMNGHRLTCHSLKALLSEGLRELEKTRPGTLEKLSHIKLRSRRIVARDRKHLFDRGHLTEKYSERLVNGWWYGTNNSAEETNAWLCRACSCSGLTWVDDFKTSLNANRTFMIDKL